MAQQGLGREIPSTPGIKGTPTALISQLIRANGCELSLEFFWTLRELWTFICPREYNKGFIIQKWSHRAVNCGEQGWDSLIGQVWSHGHPWTWAGYDCGIPRTISEGSVVLVLKGRFYYNSGMVRPRDRRSLLSKRWFYAGKAGKAGLGPAG